MPGVEFAARPLVQDSVLGLRRPTSSGPGFRPLVSKRQHNAHQELSDIQRAYLSQTPMGAEEAEGYHATQLETLKEAGADLAWVFTIGNEAEALGAVRAAGTIGIPVAVSFAVGSDGRLFGTGTPLADAVAYVDDASESYASFFGINCSHPVEFEPALSDGPWLSRLRALRPNASKMDKIALCKIGHLEEGDPVELGKLMGDLATRLPAVDIWGGCCGTTATHLDLLATAVTARRGPSND
ncbi:homocysteine S-methyltransferase family protein [Nocardioides cheoyonin]|uniref:homocysteine S-methyltransferase family protein n=1 Tax=Nocardioides cheoyonin TaxID=3156615 RepID=UPI0032B47F4F